MGVPWSAILKYEFQIRKVAFEKVRDDGMTLARAIEFAMQDAETRALYFTANVTLAARKVGKGRGEEPPNKYQKTREEPPKKNKTKGPGEGGKQSTKTAGKGRNKGKQGTQGGLPVTGTAPDGRLLCYNQNDGLECDGCCGMLHACRVVDCFDPTHIIITHPGYDASKGWGSKR